MSELNLWAVVYGNYEPTETESLWFSREEAEQHAEEMVRNWRVYPMTVQGVNRIEKALQTSNAELREAVKKLKSMLDKDGDYSICRKDGRLMGLGEALKIGDVMEQIDAVLAKEGK